MLVVDDKHTTSDRQVRSHMQPRFEMPLKVADERLRRPTACRLHLD